MKTEKMEEKEPAIQIGTDIKTILTAEEYDFVKEVFENPGGKVKKVFHHVEDGSELGKEIQLWKRPEELGLIEYVGKYRWLPKNIEMKLVTSAVIN